MLNRLADWLVYDLAGLDPASALGQSVQFFVYDSAKIILLLAVMIYGISFVRSFFPPERTRDLINRVPPLVGHLLAALLGIVTPFCSCSSVPIFIGFVEAGIPLGVTLSFLIASPIVNEVSAAMLIALFGWKMALLYIVSGVLVAVVAGWVLGRWRVERWVEPYVFQVKMGHVAEERMTWAARRRFAWENTRDIVRRVWLYVLLGVGLGAAIHGYAPQDLLVRWAGPGKPWAVPAAVLLGVPLYSNAVGTIPIVQALLGKGVAIGTALSFMMAVTALSLPEMVILRKVMLPKLVAVFVGTVTVAIMLTGFLFNWIF